MATATTKKPSKGTKEKPAAKAKQAAAKKAPAKKVAAKPAAKKPAVKKPAAKKRATKPARLPKVPIAIVRQLAEMFERSEPTSQVQGLAQTLAALGPRTPAAAQAALAHSDRGAPVARAFLTALATDDGDAADAVVQHCATMERGRKPMRDAFALVWRKATDVAAIAAAVKNFGRALLDDPALLDAGVDAAMKLGDTAVATSLVARLERANRLAPLVASLSGAAPARVRAKRELATLGAADRWHVYTRVVDAPRKFDQDVAIDAMKTLADDTAVPDMALASAIVEMRDHGQAELVAHWKAQVAAGDAHTILRMLGLFEWTALWATGDDQLAPYIHALYPAGGRPEVFASVEHALAGNSMVVREAVLEQWLRAGIRAFDDAQVDKLVRMAVTIAESGNDTGDRRAANRALFDASHPGARHALVDAIRNASTKRNAELRRNVYRGLARIAHPDLIPFLAERLFVEREEYDAMLDALGTKLDHAAHLRVLGILVERAGDADAIHAATAYADCILHKKKQPRLAIDLGKVVIAWQPHTNDDTRRLRHVFEQATVAALALSRPDDARTFLARARELTGAGAPYSDYLVKDRDQKTPSPLADTTQRIAALDSGQLDREIADARAAADAARTAGTPIAADDARLGMIAACAVSKRFFEDRDTQVVWFFDEVGTLHVYDGYSVAPPSFQFTGTGGTGIAGGGMASFVAGHPMIDERALVLDDTAARVREIVRLGDRLLVFDGEGHDDVQRIALVAYGLRFPTTAEARHTFARLVANPPAGTVSVDPWYISGGGAVRRHYHAPLPGDRGGEASLALVGNKIDGPIDDRLPSLVRAHASADAAVAALEAWETRVLVTGGRATKLWIDKHTTRPEDTLLVTFLQRYRDDGQSAAWHLRALGEMYDAIAAAGIAPPDLEVMLGPPATEAEIAAYQALVPGPLPAPLVDLWTQVGGGGYTSWRGSNRFLSPAELVARRTELRAQLRQWLEGRSGTKNAALLAIADDLDVLAVENSVPQILFDTKQRDPDGRCFCDAIGNPFVSALDAEVATITGRFRYEIKADLSHVFLLKVGERPSASARRVKLLGRGQVFEALLNGTQLLVRSTDKRFGKRFDLPTIKTLASDAAAAKAFDAVIAKARAKGFA